MAKVLLFKSGSLENVTVPNPESIDPNNTTIVSAIIEELKNINKKLDQIEDSINGEVDYYDEDESSCNCEECDNSCNTQGADAYNLPEYFDFSTALDCLKEDCKVKRVHWDSYLVITNATIDDVTSSVLAYYDKANRMNELYTPSQDDLLAEDWCLE